MYILESESELDGLESEPEPPPQKTLQSTQPCTVPKQDPPNFGEKQDALVPPALCTWNSKMFYILSASKATKAINRVRILPGRSNP